MRNFKWLKRKGGKESRAFSLQRGEEVVLVRGVWGTEWRWRKGGQKGSHVRKNKEIFQRNIGLLWPRTPVLLSVCLSFWLSRFNSSSLQSGYREGGFWGQAARSVLTGHLPSVWLWVHHFILKHRGPQECGFGTCSVNTRGVLTIPTVP